MGSITEMCNCPSQQMIESNQKSNLENYINNDDINNISPNIHQDNNDAETYNISLKGGKVPTNQKKKSKDKSCRKNSENKEKKKKKSSEKNEEQKISNMIGNKLIENNINENDISDSLVNDFTFREKLKYVSKEKISKMKDSNKINIVIIGQKEVGKSSFCIRFVENRFEDFYIPSIRVEDFTKKIAYNSRNYKVNFSVICGSDKLRNWINLIEEADFFFFFTT
jgi:hypothetical protein